MIVFGLPEEHGENVSAKVVQMFQAIGEKPRVEACRIEKENSDKTTRHVKLTASSSTVVEHMLTKVKILNQLEEYKKVFVSPDRSPEQRNQQRVLVKDLKRLRAEVTDQRHYINN